MNLPRAFTLIELLVVVTIIIVLLTLLVPTMDKAIYSAEKTVCLSNQRNQVMAARNYAVEQKKLFPPFLANDEESSAYDWRDFTSLKPAGMGLLPAGGYLPSGPPLGKLIHCPSLRNEHAVAPDLPYVGMDIPWGNIAGGSAWSVPQYAGFRIIGSYNYRAPSHESSGKGRITLANASSNLVISVDEPDLRFGAMYQHTDGYNRVFGDGHGGWYTDLDRRIDVYITSNTAGNRYFEGGRYYTDTCEKVYGFFALPDAKTALPN